MISNQTLCYIIAIVVARVLFLRRLRLFSYAGEECATTVCDDNIIASAIIGSGRGEGHPLNRCITPHQNQPLDFTPHRNTSTAFLLPPPTNIL